MAVPYQISIWHFHVNVDADSDGFGDLATTIEACSEPDGYLADATDCDDTNADINPVALEVCDEADNDCDGQADEDFWGYEESNNVLGTATDLGEIDIDGVATDACRARGIEHHAENKGSQKRACEADAGVHG